MSIGRERKWSRRQAREDGWNLAKISSDAENDDDSEKDGDHLRLIRPLSYPHFPYFNFHLPSLIFYYHLFCSFPLSLLGSLYSAIGIATTYELEDRGIGVRVPVGSSIFSSPLVRPTLGPTHSRSQWDPGIISRGKAAGAWSWPLTSNKCRGQENVDLHIHYPIRLHGVVLNQLSTGTILPLVLTFYFSFLRCPTFSTLSFVFLLPPLHCSVSANESCKSGSTRGSQFPDRSEWKKGFQPNRNGGLIWFTDGSKTAKGTGARVCCQETRRKLVLALGTTQQYSRLKYTPLRHV
jgi:hypothetical protein